MRLDHIVIHVDNDPQQLRSLKDTLNAQGYPFDPETGKRSSEFRVSNINIGDEYIEVVRILKAGAQTWMPLWTHYYDSGNRGAFCIFLEVEDAERTGVALKHAGIRARGPAVLTYPAMMGLVHLESPYYIYYLPNFPDTVLHLAVMQYKKTSGRAAMLGSLRPNADQNGIRGIRRVEIELPNLTDSLEMLHKVFENLRLENGEWTVQLEKTRMLFRRSTDGGTHLRLATVTSQRDHLGGKFEIDNVEVRTTGG